jgi:hypothetical protein
MWQQRGKCATLQFFFRFGPPAQNLPPLCLIRKLTDISSEFSPRRHVCEFFKVLLNVSTRNGQEMLGFYRHSHTLCLYFTSATAIELVARAFQRLYLPLSRFSRQMTSLTASVTQKWLKCAVTFSACRMSRMSLGAFPNSLLLLWPENKKRVYIRAACYRVGHELLWWGKTGLFQFCCSVNSNTR